MQILEREREARELDVEDIDVSRARWEKDRKVIDEILQRRKTSKILEGLFQNAKIALGGVEGPVAHAGEEGVPDEGSNGITGVDRANVIERDHADGQKHVKAV